jgi:2-iminobutanoate/2-iminopropanoate deaminase
MDRVVVSTDKAPAAVGPYSQAIIAGDFVYTAGQLSLDPKTGELLGEDVAAQTRKTIENLKSVLEAAGTSLDRVVKTTIYLTDMGNFAEMNAVYAEFFPSDPPARSTVEVGPLAKGAIVEIDAVALR